MKTHRYKQSVTNLGLLTLIFILISDKLLTAQQIWGESTREWTSSSGSKIEGTLVAIGNDTATIIVKDKEFLVKRDSLSVADQKYLENWTTRLGQRDELITATTDFFTIISGEGSYELITNGRSSQKSIQQPEEFYGSTKIAKGTKVPRNTILRTGADSWLDCQIDGVANVRVMPDSEVKIPEAAGSTIDHLKGKLFLNVNPEYVKKKNRQFVLKAPSVILAVKGTKFASEIRQNGIVIVPVLSGSVVAQSGGEMTTISQGNRLHFTNERDSKLEPLTEDDRNELESQIPPTTLIPQWDITPQLSEPVGVHAVALSSDPLEQPQILEDIVDAKRSIPSQGIIIFKDFDRSGLDWLEIKFHLKYGNVPEQLAAFEIGCRVKGGSWLSTLNCGERTMEVSQPYPSFMYSNRGKQTRSVQERWSQSSRKINQNDRNPDTTETLFDYVNDPILENGNLKAVFSIKVDLKNETSSIISCELVDAVYYVAQ